MGESRTSILERITLAVEFLFCALQLFEGVLKPGSYFEAFWCVCVRGECVGCFGFFVCQVFCLLVLFCGFFFVMFWFCCFCLILEIFSLLCGCLFFPLSPCVCAYLVAKICIYVFV